jgi:hypothetical protein
MRPSRRRKTPSPGIALIELIGAIFAATILFGIATTLLATMLRVDRSYAPQTAAQLELDRLGAYLRQDAHEAETFEIADGGKTCSFTMPHAVRVDYQVLASAVRRTESTAGDGGADATKRQDLALPAGADASLQKATVGGQPFVQLAVTNEGGESSARAIYHIDCELRAATD